MVGLVLAVCLGLLGCNPVDDAPEGIPPADPVAVDRIEMTFDGERCLSSGPVVIYEGTVIMTLSNSSENVAQLQVNTVEEGKTWQDVFEFYGQAGEVFDHPSWLGGVESAPILSEPDGREYTFEPGLHAVLSRETRESAIGVYPCTPLEVMAAP
jgi:hypothetical protein